MSRTNTGSVDSRAGESRSAATAGDRSLLRRMNLLAVLQHIFRSPQTISQLADLTGLSRTATDAVVTDLVDLGWTIAADAEPRSGAGRPARSYRFRAELGCVIGMDIGAHKVEVQVSDLAGAVLSVVRREVSDTLGAADRVAVAVECAESALGDAGRTMDEVWIASVGSPGVVLDGVVTHFIGLPDWQGLDLAAALRTALGCPVVVENDVNLAALAEHWIGVTQEGSSIVYVLVGNRTGAAIMIDNHLYRGFAGGAGELGAMPEAGWVTSQEHLAGVTLDGRELSRAEIFEHAAAGAQPAVDAVEKFSQAIATGIAAYVLALDPEIVAVGGGITSAGAAFMEPLERHVREKAIVRMPDIRMSNLGDRSVTIGAVRLALDTVDSRLAFAVTNASAFPTPVPGLIAS